MNDLTYFNFGFRACNTIDTLTKYLELSTWNPLFIEDSIKLLHEMEKENIGIKLLFEIFPDKSVDEMQRFCTNIIELLNQIQNSKSVNELGYSSGKIVVIINLFEKIHLKCLNANNK